MSSDYSQKLAQRVLAMEPRPEIAIHSTVLRQLALGPRDGGFRATSREVEVLKRVLATPPPQPKTQAEQGTFF